MANPVVHWEITGNDPEKLKEFYASLFNWEIRHVPEMNYYMCNTGENGIGGGIGKVEEATGGKPYVTFLMQVDDLQATLDKIESLGGKTIVPPTEIPNDYGIYAMFQDPDGNVLGIWKSKT